MIKAFLVVLAFAVAALITLVVLSRPRTPS
ncbi:preprotein translocase subunit SecG [Nonomuraea africana]|uniref:Preprotein translocase subunit SecG n=1 Tax=Nonomuraea africana TaxID=46171 RepID=A0ABR9KDF5_9ACTN|nr:preprotein translocase subunit SecG [Nonomuraea africana]